MNIKILVMDVDGTLTDGKVYIGNDGELFKAFDIKDGYAIKHILPKLGIVPVIITGRESKIVQNRSKELDIVDCYQGVCDKFKILEKVLCKYNCDYTNLAYIGDDINDLVCLEKAALSACPLDAIELVKKKLIMFAN